MSKPAGSFLHWIIFIALALTWGSSFILMKLGMVAFSSSQVAALRISVAWIFLLPLAFRHLKREHVKLLPWFFGMGFFGNLLPAFLFTAAETRVSSALAGMLNSLTPLFTLLIGLFVFRLRVNRWQMLGVITGLGGAIGLLALKTGEANVHPWQGGALVVIATLSYGISVNIIRAKLGGMNAVAATLWAMCCIGPIATAYLFTTDFVHVLQTNPEAWSSFGYTALLGIFGTALSVIVFNILIRDAGALFASSVTYLIPVVAMLWGLVLHETILWWHALFIGVILAGIKLISRK
jgi:drug/metabolite transporter (DMT)-like permease